MKFFFKISLILLFSFQIKAQLLFYQDTYKGGVTSDGRTYESLDYLQADSINFQLHISAGSTIRKAFLISHRGFTYTNEVDDSLQLNFNNHSISFDSSDIITSLFNCNYSTPSANNWIVAKDVTAFTQLSNNKLIVPCQSCLMSSNPNRHFVYAGFLLVVMYENNALPLVNPVIFLNNKTDNTSLIYSFSGLNKINTANEVALSVYTNNPDKDSITFNLSSSLGNTYLGSIGINDFGTPDSIYHYAPGSFYYENNTAFQLKDDNPNNGFDTTDALTPLKNYIANNTQTFTINTTQQVSGGCEDLTDAFILAYSSPCPPRSNVDTIINYAPVCSGKSVQLIGNSIGNYTWTPSSGLNHNNISNPIATTNVTTNYIALVDSVLKPLTI